MSEADATRIAKLSATRLDVPLLAPFGIAGGAQEIAKNAVVTIELADGTRGHGEAAPLPAYDGETQDEAMRAVDVARGAVEGKDARGWRTIARDVGVAAKSSNAARCAIETAVLDALTRRAGLSLHAFFGGAEPSLVTDVTIPLGALDRAVAEARERSAFATLKIKIGSGSVDDDVARVIAIHEAAPRAAVLLDGNGGMSAPDAILLAEKLAKHAIVPVLFEQPVPGDDWHGLAEVSRRCGCPVAADESVRTAKDAMRVANERAAHVVNVKLMKAGVAEAMAVVEVARAAGLGLMIGGMVEAKLAMSMSACFAAGLGGFSFVDLDTPLFLAHDPFDGGYRQDGATLDLGPIARGHGVRPRAE